MQVLATGTFGPTVSHLTATQNLSLNLKLRCIKKQDAYINVVFPIPGGQSISLILTRHCKVALSPIQAMSREVQEQKRQTLVAPQGRVGVPHPPLSPRPS
jgi:hypothetical protein